MDFSNRGSVVGDKNRTWGREEVCKHAQIWDIIYGCHLKKWVDLVKSLPFGKVSFDNVHFKHNEMCVLWPSFGIKLE